MFHNSTMRNFIFLSFIFLLSVPGHAESSQLSGTRIQLSATAEQSVSNDEMIVYYRIEETGFRLAAGNENLSIRCRETWKKNSRIFAVDDILPAVSQRHDTTYVFIS